MYASVKDMWDHELQKVPDRYSKDGWYGAALEYWENTPATTSGVLGGLDHVHDIDIAASRAFLEEVKPAMSRDYALDCGAGVGRVSKNLLLPMFAKVDLLEPIAKMLEVAKKDLDNSRVGNFMLSSMETAKLAEATYDVVLIQWAALYLTDDDLAAFLAMSKRSLKPNGIIFFKENCTSDDSFVVDKDDSSLTRSDAHYKRIFDAAGVKCVKEVIQPQWPKDLFQVRMYALQ
jgi:protein N-terminal methyltransferase